MISTKRWFDTMGQVRQDHMRLRQILAFVEGTMHLGVPARPILLEACVAFARQLDQHAAREGMMRIRTHRTQVQRLRALARELAVDPHVMPQNIDAALYAIVEDLQQQMGAQEERLRIRNAALRFTRHRH